MTFISEKSIFFQELLTTLLGKEVSIQNIQMQGGGCINKAAVINTSEGKYFVKWNYITLREMFEVEVKGLELLRSTNIVEIPKVLGLVDAHDESFLFLEMIEPETICSSFWEDFGRKLAKMHQVTNKYFGLTHDNYIGSLVQKNNSTEDWNDFFYHQRLIYQLQLAFDSGKMDKSILIHFENLYRRLNEILPKELPALLHGDLWGGNILKGKNGEVCLIDPAVYYGHREMELAYTMLFDNNPDTFYQAYELEYPLEKDFDKRIPIYNLYPLLVHVNLFGGGYINQVKSIVEKY